MRNLRRLALILSLSAAVPAIALSSSANAQTTVVAPVTAQDRVLGRADAPVTVVEYASFACNHCAAWHNGVYPEFKRRFVDTGQVRYVFRNLPTAPPQMSLSGAALARCAAPERFFDVAASLMQGQQAVLEGGRLENWYDPAIAASGRSRAEIEACTALAETRTAIDRDIETANAAGVNSTPSFFINGRPVTDRSIEGLGAAIRAAAPAR
jgi:protein-disulfide isomerase